MKVYVTIQRKNSANYKQKPIILFLPHLKSAPALLNLPDRLTQ